MSDAELVALVIERLREVRDRDIVEGWLEILCEKVVAELEDSGQFAGPRQ